MDWVRVVFIPRPHVGPAHGGVCCGRVKVWSRVRVGRVIAHLGRREAHLGRWEPHLRRRVGHPRRWVGHGRWVCCMCPKMILRNSNLGRKMRNDSRRLVRDGSWGGCSGLGLILLSWLGLAVDCLGGYRCGTGGRLRQRICYRGTVHPYLFHYFAVPTLRRWGSFASRRMD